MSCGEARPVTHRVIGHLLDFLWDFIVLVSVIVIVCESVLIVSVSRFGPTGSLIDQVLEIFVEIVGKVEGNCVGVTDDIKAELFLVIISPTIDMSKSTPGVKHARVSLTGTHPTKESFPGVF